MTEKQVKKTVLEKLAKHFHIDNEVIGTHLSGKRGRIDTIISPIDKSNWLNKKICFGIEFKRYSKIEFNNFEDRGNYYSKHVQQVVDYHYTDFKSYGFIPILLCPSPLQNKNHDIFIKRFLGQMNIGELKKFGANGLSIVFNVHHCIWSENFGVVDGKFNGLNTKFHAK